MASDQPPFSPRRAAAAAWLTMLLTLAWAKYSLSRFESGWSVTVIAVLAVVAFALPIALQRSTRELGIGLSLGAVVGLGLAALVALAV